MHKVLKSLLRGIRALADSRVHGQLRPGLVYTAEGLWRSGGTPRGGSRVWRGRTRGGSGGGIPVQMAAGRVHQLMGVGGVTSGVRGSESRGQRGKQEGKCVWDMLRF
jgi:hypothetical protein